MLIWLEGHTANKILTPLQSLISCFLKHSANRRAVVGVPGCPEGSTICCVLVAVAQVGGDSSVLNLLCAKDQANENCEHRSGIQQIFRQVMKGIPQHIFPTAFSSLLSAPLSIYATV